MYVRKQDISLIHFQSTMNKIIAISGPSSTGKTTLFNRLQNKLLGVHFYPEFIRIYVKENNISSDIFNDPVKLFDFQMHLCLYTEEKLKDIHETDHLCIVDRSPLDCIAYSLMAYSSLDDRSALNYKDVFHSHIRKMYDLMHLIDTNYMTRINETYFPENDGFRLKQYISKRALEIELFHLLEMHEKVILLPDSINEREQTIVNMINKKLTE